jgi:hypothetical protein
MNLPQVAEKNTPRSMDVAGNDYLYDEGYNNSMQIGWAVRLVASTFWSFTNTFKYIRKKADSITWFSLSSDVLKE